MKLAHALVAALGLAILAPVASAEVCGWMVTPNISPDDRRSKYTEYDSGAWSFVMHDVGPFHCYAYLATKAWMLSLSDAGSGNGSFTVTRFVACDEPLEDIEATCRVEYKAHAELDDDNFSRAAARMYIKGSKLRDGAGGVMLAEADGGVEVTDTPYLHGESSGVQELELSFKGSGVKVPIQWSTGGSKTATFSDASSGSGGTSPEIVYSHNDTQLEANLGGIRWIQQTAKGKIYDSKWELRLWGTCDGECAVIKHLFTLSTY